MHVSLKPTNPQETALKRLNKDHEDHVSEKCFLSLSDYNLLRGPVPKLQAMRVPDAQVAVDSEWVKLAICQHGERQKVKDKKSEGQLIFLR